MTAKITGEPGDKVYALFIGDDAQTLKITKYGHFHLKEPYLTIALQSAISADGILRLDARIPQSPAAPYDLYMQVLKDSTYLGDSLTNLEAIKIR